jgi:hypothetical protein
MLTGLETGPAACQIHSSKAVNQRVGERLAAPRLEILRSQIA